MRVLMVFASVDFGGDVDLPDAAREQVLDGTAAAVRAALAPGFGLQPRVTVALGEAQPFADLLSDPNFPDGPA